MIHNIMIGMIMKTNKKYIPIFIKFLFSLRKKKTNCPEKEQYVITYNTINT